MRLFARIGGKNFFLGAVILVVLTAVLCRHLVTANRFATEGRQTAASVERAHTTERRGEHSMIPDDHLDPSFTTESGQRVAVSTKVSRARYDTVRDGDRLDLWYLPSNPQAVNLVQGSNENHGTVTRWVTPLMGVFRVSLLWFSGRKAVAGYLARQHGRLRKAEGPSVGRIQTRKEGTWCRLVWRDDAGRVCKSLRYLTGNPDGCGPGKTLVVYPRPQVVLVARGRGDAALTPVPLAISGHGYL